MSFLAVVDSASVASCLVKVSFCWFVDPSAGSRIGPVVTQENMFRMYEFSTRCHVSSGLADYLLYFSGDFHDKDYLRPVGECHACPVVCSVL